MIRVVHAVSQAFFLHNTTKETLYDVEQGAYTGTRSMKLDKLSIIPVILKKYLS